MTHHNLVLSTLWAALLILCWTAVGSALNLGWQEDRYVQIIAAPPFFAFLMYWDRKRIFANPQWSATFGIPLLAFALAMYFVLLRHGSYLAMLAVIVAWMAVFLLCYGPRSFRAACFPLGCLLLMIPIPIFLIDALATGLQHASAATSIVLLRLAGIPVFAEGTKLSFAGLDIEVAPQCSGIHSCLALGLMGLLVGRISLRRVWSRSVLIVSTVPIAIFKNAIRISTLGSLSAYVDHGILNSPIHHYGGLLVAPLGVALFLVFLALLRKIELWMSRRPRAERTTPEAAAARTV